MALADLDEGPRIGTPGRSALTQAVAAPLPSAGRGSVAIVHDWCPSFRGGERVVAQLCAKFDKPPVYTLFDFLSQDVKDEFFDGVAFHTSIANGMPGIKRYYRGLFFACPFLIEQFDVTGYDAIISSSAAFARGVITRPDQPHLCYVHSPIRYAWDEQFSYLTQGRLGYGPKGMAFRFMLHYLRQWDSRTAHGPDLMVANSRFIRQRIRRVYGRDALVVHPPVDTSAADFVCEKDDYYVTASFLAPYKRTDLVIEAFRAMPDRRLIVVGDGQQSESLRKLAAPNISFAGFLDRADYVKTVARAKALVFAGCEDFGIALAEAQGWGTPVIALERGGARDIVRPLGSGANPTGVLFAAQTRAAVEAAVEAFEDNRDAITPEACRMQATSFAPERFDRGIEAALDQAISINKDEGGSRWRL